jgi:hypothetical protein
MMVNAVKEISYLRKYEIITGISLLIMAIAAGFSYGFVYSSLVVPSDASTTFNNILSTNALFKAGIFSWLIILVCDIVVAWGLYIIFEPLHKRLAWLGAILRLVYSSILGIAIMNLIFVFILTNEWDVLATFNQEQLQAYVMILLKAFESIWAFGLIIFGGHLLVIGYLSFKANTIPKVISILLVIASIGYMFIHFCKVFLPQFKAVTNYLEVILSVPMALGELGLGIWLIYMGLKVPKKRNLKSYLN